MTDYQNVLFPYAYNILGSAEDARDAIQDVVCKFTSKNFEPTNEKNYLIRGVINESINLKKKKSRTQQLDNWLPEPVATDRTDLAAELKDLVSYSVMILLEKLSPKERAVFILKEAFSYTHPEISEVLGIRVEASRKLLSRAHQQLQRGKSAIQHSQSQLDLIDKLISAVQNKDLEKLHAVLSEDIAYTADGGNKVKVFKRFCEGPSEVANLLVHVYHTYQRKASIRPTWINHQPALLFLYRDKVTACQIFLFDNDTKIKHISTVVDPTKLKYLNLHA